MPVPRRQFLTSLAAVATTAGCTRFALPAPGALDEPGPGPRAGVRLRAFATDADRRDGVPFAHEVHTELWLLREDGPRELVHRSRDGAWTRGDLVPGRYELVVVEVSDGEQARPPKGRDTRRFDLAEGELADVVLTVRSFPWEAVVVVGIVVIIIVGVLILLSGKSDGLLPKPPPPPSPALVAQTLLIPPGPHLLFLPVDVYVSAPWPDDDYGDYPPPAPPPTGPYIASISPRGLGDTVVVHFSTPMRAADLGPDTLRIQGPGGPVAVGVSLDEDGRAARVRPLRPLPPGRYGFRVYGKALHDEDGTTLDQDVQIGFDVG